MYVDNLGVIALEQEMVIVVMAELEQLFSGGGLALLEFQSRREDGKFWRVKC